MTSERQQWADAFLRQGKSDLKVYGLLAAQPVDEFPLCHQLHYLQMACEKIAKAYRVRDTNAKLQGDGSLLRKHVGFAKFMSAFLLSPQFQKRYQGKTRQLEEVRKRAVAVAREVEKMAPAVGQDASPENAEYPWLSNGRIVSPLDYGFPGLSLLHAPGGINFLKLIKQAVRDFDTTAIR